ncbi:MAG: hypothetical protein AAF621_03640 [Pseudomonadota bacterium]
MLAFFIVKQFGKNGSGYDAELTEDRKTMEHIHITHQALYAYYQKMNALPSSLVVFARYILDNETPHEDEVAFMRIFDEAYAIEYQPQSDRAFHLCGLFHHSSKAQNSAPPGRFDRYKQQKILYKSGRNYFNYLF